jgi:16S rRNA (uracil1498-N3)-methyltransferase
VVGVSAPRVFVPDATGGAGELITLPHDEGHHAAHVMRARPGDRVIAFDGRGREWDAVVNRVGKRDVVITIERDRIAAREPAVRVTLGVGLLKGDHMDAVVRDATALGAAEIVPIVSEHCVVPKAARSGEAGRIERWMRVAVASAKQCGRATLPHISDITPLRDLTLRPADLKLICLEPAHAGARAIGPITRPPAWVILLVGPEGGWSAAEVAAARAAGCQAVHLGPRVLRAELAPVVAISALWTAIGH